MLEPTSPLTTSKDIDQALQKLIINSHTVDSIVGVGEVSNSHPKFCVTLNTKNIIKPFQNNKFSTLRRQDVSKLFFYDGSLYISSIKKLYKEKSFYHKKTMGLFFPKYKNYEIDDIYDFICVEALMKKSLSNEK